MTAATFRNAAAIVLRGVGQVMFQAHAGTGLFFLAGIALASPTMLVGALIGAVVGPLTARLASFDRDGIDQGLYGFNATLTGLATPFFLRPSFPIVWALLVVGCVGATFLTRLARRFLKFPAYTAPFILTTWAIIAAAHAASGSAVDVPRAAPTVSPGGFVAQVLKGEAEVMLGAGVVAGVLFLVGIALSDPWHAGIALIGSAAGTATALYHGDAAEPVSIGIYGYNAALAATALFLIRRSLTLPLLAALVATALTEFFPKGLGLPALTAPFVAASWLLLAVLWIESRLFPEDRRSSSAPQ